MSQSKKQSMVEVTSNTFIGMIGSWIITFSVISTIKTPSIAAATTVILCTIWSLVRGYYVRRHFNRNCQ